jgi:hypothetical protein
MIKGKNVMNHSLIINGFSNSDFNHISTAFIATDTTGGIQ